MHACLRLSIFLSFPTSPPPSLPRTHTLSTPAVARNLPAGHDVHVAATEEVDPTGPYLPAAHKEPEHVEAPVMCIYIYMNTYT